MKSEVRIDDAINAAWQKYSHRRNRSGFAQGAEIDSLVNTLREKLPKSEIKGLEERFSFDGGDPLPELGQLYQKQKYLTHRQAWTLRKWKSPQGGSLKFGLENSEPHVRLTTQMAAMAADKYIDAPDFAAIILMALKRVGIPVASAFLAAWNPNEFGIVDRRVRSALFRLTDARNFSKTAFDEKDFYLYTMIFRRWSEKEGLSPRLIDKALWQYDRETSV